MQLHINLLRQYKRTEMVKVRMPQTALCITRIQLSAVHLIHRAFLLLTAKFGRGSNINQTLQRISAEAQCCFCVKFQN